LRTNQKISFPEHYAQGRIVIDPGLRMIDWNGEEWIVFVKDGVRWYRDEFNDDDFLVLQNALSDQLRSVLG
jgi:hypothetical protein